MYSNGQFAYKLYEPRYEAGGAGTGIKGELVYDNNGVPSINYTRGAARDVQAKATVLSRLGMPTEVHGVIGSTGEVVTKQPQAYTEAELSKTLPPGTPLDRSQIKTELGKMGAVRLPMSDPNSPWGCWLVNAGGRYYIVSDVKRDNVLFNSQGKARLFDAVVTPVSEIDFNRNMDLEQARRATRPLSADKPF